MASRDILMTELSSAAVDRIARMPAWFETSVSATPAAMLLAPVAVLDDVAGTEPSWLDDDGAAAGVEVIEHQVPAELLAAFFGPAASRNVRVPQLGR